MGFIGFIWFRVQGLGSMYLIVTVSWAPKSPYRRCFQAQVFPV